MCYACKKLKQRMLFFPLNQSLLVHSHLRGQKSYNGVAILSRFPFLEKNNLNYVKITMLGMSVTFKNSICIHNFYVP